MRTKFSLGLENERADARRDGRTCLARPISQRGRGQGEFIFPVQLTKREMGNQTRLVSTLLQVVSTLLQVVSTHTYRPYKHVRARRALESIYI